MNKTGFRLVFGGMLGLTTMIDKKKRKKAAKKKRKESKKSIMIEVKLRWGPSRPLSFCNIYISFNERIIF